MFTNNAHPDLMYWFIALIVGLISLDLLVLQRKDHVMTFREAVGWSLFWVGIAALFNGWIFWYLGQEAALIFTTGYLIEMSLSVDNLFVFILIFGAFKLHPKMQHRVLFWGILGALIMRALCISVGVAALQRFEWLEFVFAGILLWAGFKTLFQKEEADEDPTTGLLARLIRKVIPIQNDYHGDKFFVKTNHKWSATPLFLVLLLIEASDVIFAVDSIPAVLAVTTDPFLVYSSNIFAILGLRSLYFVLSSMVHSFRFLGTGVSIILIFIGVKMGVARWYHLPVSWALAFIIGTLVLSVSLSLLIKEKVNKEKS